MKINVYQVIRNIGGELEIEIFSTNSQADDCAWEHIKNIYTEDGGADGYEVEEFDLWRAQCGNDKGSAWEALNDDSNDSLHVQTVEIEVPTQSTSIYMLITDTDDGLQTDLFSSATKRDEAAFEWLAERDDAGRTATQIAEEFEGDPLEAGLTISNSEDYFNIDDVLIDLPGTNPAPALLAALKRLNQESQTVGGPSGETWRMADAAIAAAEAAHPRPAEIEELPSLQSVIKIQQEEMNMGFGGKGGAS
jgi:hypothetical protein